MLTSKEYQLIRKKVMSHSKHKLLIQNSPKEKPILDVYPKKLINNGTFECTFFWRYSEDIEFLITWHNPTECFNSFG